MYSDCRQSVYYLTDMKIEDTECFAALDSISDIGNMVAAWVWQKPSLQLLVNAYAVLDRMHCVMLCDDHGHRVVYASYHGKHKGASEIDKVISLRIALLIVRLFAESQSTSRYVFGGDFNINIDNILIQHHMNIIILLFMPRVS